MKNPHGPPSKGGKAAKPTSMRKKRGNDEDDDEEEEDDDEPASGKSVPELLLANKWDIETGLDPTGWWVSEKLDGVRYGWEFSLMFGFSNSDVTARSTTANGSLVVSEIPSRHLNGSWIVSRLNLTPISVLISLQNFRRI